MPRPEVFIWFSGASGSATAAVSKPSPSSPTTISRSSVEPPRVSMTRRDGSWRFPCLIAFARAVPSSTPIQCSASFSMPRTRQTYSSTAWPSSRFSYRLESHSTIGPGEADDSVIADERGDALLSSTLDGYLPRRPERRAHDTRARRGPSIAPASRLRAPGRPPRSGRARGGRAPDRRTPPRSGSGRPEARRESPGRAVSRDGRFGDPAREGPRPRAREEARRGPASAVSPLRRLSRGRRLFRPRAGPRAEAHGALRTTGRRLLRSRREEVLHRAGADGRDGRGRGPRPGPLGQNPARGHAPGPRTDARVAGPPPRPRATTQGAPGFVRRPPLTRGLPRGRSHRRDDGRTPDPAAGRGENTLRRGDPCHDDVRPRQGRCRGGRRGRAAVLRQGNALSVRGGNGVDPGAEEDRRLARDRRHLCPAAPDDIRNPPPGTRQRCARFPQRRRSPVVR